MQIGRIIKTALVVGVVVNVFDYLVHNVLLRAAEQNLPFMNPDPSIAWLVIGDFVAALVLVWVFDRVRGSFGPGAAGGAAYGFYAGVLVNFPTWIFMHLLITGMPYHAAWLATLIGVVWGVLAGAVAGAVYGKPEPAAA